MDYKEKYEHGVECIQEILSGAGDLIKTSILRKRLQPFFPELKESEGERIRKGLIKILNEIVINTNYKELGIDYNIRDMIAWLEKQGEQTHAELSQQEVTKTSDQEPPDKVEPKFKVGDWIVGNDGTFKITQYEDEYGYELTDTTGCVVHFISPNYVESNFHLWTIADAKVGDVVVRDKIPNYPSPFIAIFRMRSVDTFSSHCFVGFNGNFYKGEVGHSLENLHPATKEQQELLFQKMEEAGCKWDNVYKKLTILLHKQDM